MNRYWFDTEFIEDGTRESITLLSIGIVAENGETFYAENGEADWSRADPWVQENVIPHLKGPTGPVWMTKQAIADGLRRFITIDTKPEIWAYYGDYDWVVLCQLFGKMISLPEGWPMFAMDVKQLAVSLGNPKLPEQTSVEHNALNDALWTRQAWEFLTSGGR